MVIGDNPLSAKVLAPKLITEFVGTLFITLAMGMTMKENPQAPLAVAGTLMAMVYTGAHISGAHYNPTVTIAVWVRGACKWQEMLLYILFQIMGAYGGGGLARAFTGADKLGYPTFHYYWHAAIVEFVWSVLWATVVLNTASSSSTVNNSFFGLATGFVVFSGMVIVGPISGGAFSMASGLALPCIALDAAKTWMYVLMPAIGGAFAGLLFHFTSPNDFKNRFTTSETANLIASLLMEMFSTFYIALYVALLPYHTNHPLSAVAHFALASALLYTSGAISGCHMNPAVSIAVFIRFKFGMKPSTRETFRFYKLALYIFFQMLGALAAAGTGCTLMYTDIIRPTGFPLPPDPSRYGQVISFFAELVGTFLLVLVFLNVTTVKKVEGNSYFGVATGITYAALTVALGPISGGCFNPAVALLTAVRGAFVAGFSFVPIWIYYVACPLGGALAAILFRALNLEEYAEDQPSDVAKRYSVMTSGMEDDNKYHAQGRLNDAAQAIKRASVQGAANARMSAMHPPPAGPPPGASSCETSAA